MKNFLALYILTSYKNISKIRRLIKIRFCRNTKHLCVIALFYQGNWRDAGLQLLYHLSLSCFVNKLITSWYHAVTKSFIIDDVGVRHPPCFVCFLCKTLRKRLKFNEIDIYMFKFKKKSTRTRSEICSKLTIKTPKRR